MSGHDSENRYVSSRVRKVDRDGADVTSGVRQFHTRGPATENARLPTVQSLQEEWSPQRLDDIVVVVIMHYIVYDRHKCLPLNRQNEKMTHVIQHKYKHKNYQMQSIPVSGCHVPDRPSNGRPGLCMAVWVQVNIRGRVLSLRPIVCAPDLSVTWTAPL